MIVLTDHPDFPDTGVLVTCTRCFVTKPLQAPVRKADYPALLAWGASHPCRQRERAA